MPTNLLEKFSRQQTLVWDSGCKKLPMEAATSRAATATCNGVNEIMYTLANEPSVGLYYVVEHIQRSLPALVADKATLNSATEQLQGVDLDAGFALEDIRAVTSGGTSSALSHVTVMARNAAERQRMSRTTEAQK